jgi:hypothetical protein
MSIAAIMHRALDLDLINSTTYKHFVISYKRNGRHRQKPGEYCCPEKSIRFEHLVLRATLEAIISISKGAALLGKPVDHFQDKISGSHESSGVIQFLCSYFLSNPRQHLNSFSYKDPEKLTLPHSPVIRTIFLPPTE